MGNNKTNNTKKNDVERMMKYDPYKVLIITCWILLGICCLTKLFWSDLFTIHAKNETFINVCNYIQNSFWFYIVTIPYNTFTCSLYYMAVLKQKKPDLRWFIPLVVYNVIKSFFYYMNILFFVLDTIMMIGLPILLNPRKWYRAIIGYFLTLIFQVISWFLKLDNYNIFLDNLVVGLILCIDYVIMLILFWLYSIKNNHKEGKVWHF